MTLSPAPTRPPGGHSPELVPAIDTTATAGAGPAALQRSGGPVPAAAADTAEEGWWDGSGSLAQSAPAVTEQGRCAVLGGGWFALLGPGSLSKSCGGVDGSLAGSPVGVGWVEGFDAEGSYVEVHLGDTTAACDTGGRRR